MLIFLEVLCSLGFKIMNCEMPFMVEETRQHIYWKIDGTVLIHTIPIVNGLQVITPQFAMEIRGQTTEIVTFG
ncbi:hypothetical protein D3C71_2029870 [compost metagenome]